ncbi:MAG: hypothetical protein AABZ32_08580 [Bacteroidota bacterium]
MDEETLSAIVLFGGGLLAAFIGTYLVLRYAKKEEHQQAEAKQ